MVFRLDSFFLGERLSARKVRLSSRWAVSQATEINSMRQWLAKRLAVSLVRAWSRFPSMIAVCQPCLSVPRRSRSAMIRLSETFSDPAVMSALYRNERAFPKKLSGDHTTSV